MSTADEAMNRYADGDDGAFGDLYDDLAPRLLRFAASQMRNRATAEDIVQQTFLQMHSARDRFRRGASVAPWAFAIARRLMLDALKRKDRRVLPHDDAKAGEDANGPDGELYGKQLEACVVRALEGLPQGQREAFLLVRAEGLSVAEAAEVLGITVTATKVRAHRAYEALRGVLAAAAG